MSRLDRYIGLPWLDRGLTAEGCDCEGLLRLVYAGCGLVAMLGIAAAEDQRHAFFFPEPAHRQRHCARDGIGPIGRDLCCHTLVLPLGHAAL